MTNGHATCSLNNKKKEFNGMSVQISLLNVSTKLVLHPHYISFKSENQWVGLFFEIFLAL